MEHQKLTLDNILRDLRDMAQKAYETSDYSNAIRAQTHLLKAIIDLRKQEPGDMSLFSTAEVNQILDKIDCKGKRNPH